MIIDRTTIPSAQPKPEISPWLTGAKTNWPTDPPAVAMPSHRLRRDSGATRPTSARGSVIPIPEAPRPTTSPALSSMTSGVVDCEIR